MQTWLTVDSGALVCVITAIGMSVAFLFADRASRTTRMLAIFLICIGISIFLNVAFVRGYAPENLPWQSYWAPVFTGLSLMFGSEWILRIRRMVPAGELRTHFGDAQFRLAQIFALVYIVLGVRFNALRAEYFIGAFEYPGVWRLQEFWYFAAPFGLAVFCVIDGVLITMRRKPDRPEAVRLIGIALASPLIAMGLLLPAPWAAYSSALGQMVFLVSAVQYHVLQGQRGQFLKRFLAPAVAQLVKHEGLDSAIQQQKLTVAAVACDLRGYTRFAQEQDSHAVIDVLQCFYDEVGVAAKAHGATIKDYAGDGILLLLGAPLPVASYSTDATALAAEIRQRCQRAFAARGIDLGLGIGVASGMVSVGVIGKERLEYVAVGPAINLAARLCQSAAAGEILVDEKTWGEQLGQDRFEAREALSLKGLDADVAVWNLQQA